MNNIALLFGTILMFVGGGLLVMALIYFAGGLACAAWIAFSDRFRSICRAESLIFDYRKNRREFLRWKEGNDGKTD